MIEFFKNLDALSLLFTVGIIITAPFLAWTYTKAGKKWLKNL